MSPKSEQEAVYEYMNIFYNWNQNIPMEFLGVWMRQQNLLGKLMGLSCLVFGTWPQDGQTTEGRRTDGQVSHSLLLRRTSNIITWNACSNGRISGQPDYRYCSWPAAFGTATTVRLRSLYATGAMYRLPRSSFNVPRPLNARHDVTAMLKTVNV